VLEGKVSFDPQQCDQCDACLRACSINANPMVQTMSVEAVLARLTEHHLMLDGITLSGGEATLQAHFIGQLFKAIKADARLRHLSCFIDSNGQLGSSAWQRLLPVTDGVLLDIKALDADLHQTLTGRSNQRVLQSLRLLHQADKLHELRYLVIPGFTDRPSEVHALVELVQSLGTATQVRLNAFQHHGVIGPAREWPTASKNDIEIIAGQLRQQGIERVITPAVYI
jgi:YjjW family glycine radical enzyme activase